MLTNIKSNFNRKAWIFIVTAIVIDLILNLVHATRPFIVYPVVGLFLVSVLCGPWAGALTGLLGQIIIGAVFFLVFPESRDNPISLFFPSVPLSMFMGYFAGRMSQWGYFKSWWLTVLTGFLTAAAATALYGAMHGLFATNDSYPNSLSVILDFLSGSIFSAFPAFPIIISALLIFFLLKSPLNKYFIGLPQIGHINSFQNSGATTAQKILGVVVLAILMPWILFLTLFVLASLH